MAYQVLARKWRPRQFEDMIGQKHVVQCFRNSLKSGKIGQAYLLTGTRGVGKTSMARIVAKSLRCEQRSADGNPCLTCSQCLGIDLERSMDVLEIDGASNNGVDHARKLIETVNYLPTTGRYKIIIIDEVHMLSKEAFNALLKTLEEPPEHMVFIFATTVPEKLLDTVLSRCFRLDFKTVLVEELLQHLQKITQQENIQFERDGLLKKIAIEARGSVRDALSLLDQVLSFCDGPFITEEAVIYALGLARESDIDRLLSAVLQGNVSELAQVYHDILMENVDLKKICLAFFDRLQVMIKEKKGADEYTMAELIWIYETLMKDFAWALDSMAPVDAVEIVLQKIAYRREFFQLKGQMPSPSVEEKKKPVMTATTIVAPASTSEPAPTQTNLTKETWAQFIKALYKNSPALAANLEQGNLLAIDGHRISWGFPLAGKIFFEHLNRPESKSKLQKLAENYFQRPEGQLSIEFSLIGHEDTEAKEFKSLVQLEASEQEKIAQDKKKQLLENEFIQEAARLFNAQVEQVYLNRE